MSARSTKRGWRGAILFAVVISLLGGFRPAAATYRYGPIQISGDVNTQWWIRHPQFNNLSFVQNRNTARLRFDWDLVKKGKLLDQYNVPFIERSSLYILYRGVYDSFYDIAPGGNQKGVTRYDDIVGGTISGHSIGTVNADGSLKSGQYSRFTDKNRDEKKFDNTLREAYIDLKLADAPLSLRLGRQQVIWGESDSFRLMDVWNPLDLSWHVQQEEWDKIRIPLWLIKGIWDTGRLGPLSNTFVEMVWNPGDYQPGVKVDWLPNPWSIPIADPTRPGQVQLASSGTSGSGGQPLFFTPVFDLQGTNFQRGKFHRNPAEASDVGIRFHGVTQQGIEFTTNYLYARGRGTGMKAGSPFALDIKQIIVPTGFLTSNAVGFFGQPGTVGADQQPVFPANVKAEVLHPYTHIFGVTGNYFEGTFTNAVFRLEMAYQMSAPFQTAARSARTQAIGCSDPNDPSTCETDEQGDPIFRLNQAPVGVTNRDLWSGMIGFDRPTWIKWLNNKTTWFLTGQFFWSYVLGSHRDLRGGVLTASENPYFTPQNPAGCETTPAGCPFPSNVLQNGIGQWQSGSFAGQTERVQNAQAADSVGGNVLGVADNVRQWELLTTLAALTFYRGGTVNPFIAVAIDPVNQNFLSQLKLNYFFTNNLVMELRQNYYFRFGGGQGPSLDPWGAGGLLARRDETGVRITYQF